MDEGFPVELCAVCDKDVSRITAKLEFNLGNDNAPLPDGIHIYSDIDELIREEDFDVADICLPTFLHKDMTVKLLSAGKHVICEKPMALTSADCEEMIRASKAYGKRLMIAQVLRFDGAYRFLKDAVNSGRYGRLDNIYMDRHSVYPSWGASFKDNSVTGGATLDTHIHDVDVARFIFGEPDRVFASEFCQPPNYQVVTTTLGFGSTTAIINCSWDSAYTKAFTFGFRARFEDAEKPELDDVIYIDTDTEGGVIAGSNPRAVLIAVYEYLRKNGCEWLMPGVDGEFIPVKDIVPVKYRHKPPMRHRGNCIEGAASQQIMEDFLDFMPKLGLNCFMIQFRNPIEFYSRYYDHWRNDDIRPKEPITKETSIQWTRRMECEMDKRGIMLHSCGHGWTNDPFGIDSSLAWNGTDDDVIPPENLECIAMVNGKRGFWHRRPANTQFCMSNKRARELFVDYVADYCASHSNTDYLHLWLADYKNNHCECEECLKKSVPDWYVHLLNEVDEELTRRELKSRILFIVYEDLTWAPKTETFKNPDRFIMMIAPINRDYSKSMGEYDPSLKLRPFVRNKLTLPQSLQEFMLYVKEWQKVWGGDVFAFEYHFWKHHQFDLSGLQIAKRLYEDTKTYHSENIVGMMQCGSQRGFFPNGFAFYTHARAMFEFDTPLCELEERYFSAAYGEDWRLFRDTLKALSDAVPYEYLSTEHAKKRAEVYHIPEMRPAVESLAVTAEKLLELVKSHYNSDYRVRTVSVRLLERYAEYIKLLTPALLFKVEGKNEEAREAYEPIRKFIGETEVYFEPYDDHLQKTGFIKQILELDEPEVITFQRND